MKIAVIGSREFKDLIFINGVLDGLFEHDNVLISGGAIGVDKYAENFVKTLHFYEHEPIIFKAMWDDLSFPDRIIKTNKFGKKYDARAGIRRNQLIVDKADMIIAFWDGKSNGTKSTIDMAIKVGKPVDIYIR